MVAQGNGGNEGIDGVQLAATLAERRLENGCILGILFLKVIVEEKTSKPLPVAQISFCIGGLYDCID